MKVKAELLKNEIQRATTLPYLREVLVTTQTKASLAGIDFDELLGSCSFDFGGRAPEGYRGILCWSATQLLLQKVGGEFVLVTRTDLDLEEWVTALRARAPKSSCHFFPSRGGYKAEVRDDGRVWDGVGSTFTEALTNACAEALHL